MLSFAKLDQTFNRVLGAAFGVADQTPTTCPQQDPDELFKKLTGIKVAGVQVIKDEDARGVSDSLVATVRCNAFAEAERGARQGARQVLVPIVAIAGAAAVVSVVAAVVTAASGRRAARLAAMYPARGYAGHRGRRRYADRG